ncbi:MAG: carboxylating nicotinate-nucleotide diphosphorylase [Armatimonadetes bacterium]|nr:carboxylating nicotinate-nucleotide diphosphorylase [Armatimonadota bacterium]
MITLDPIYLESIAKMALMEDIGGGDITTMLTVSESEECRAIISAKEVGIVAGVDVANAVFDALDGDVSFRASVADGMNLSVGEEIALVIGLARNILTAERVALNFLQRMSGIATLTAKYVSLVSHTKARIVDTRKTTPGLRRLEKYSVVIGGGHNHRFGLSDGILIKDNHITAAGGLTAAIKSAKRFAPHTLKIEVEVISLDQLDEAINAGAEAILLDNMSLEMMRQAVEFASGRVQLEASGGVSEDTVKDIAETGVDLISVGALTHSAPALDISMNFT